ncbi:DNA replication/repair protein RecF [Bifidobacterium biavatii]|uniref:DNA replication and repair protein RecF n=1 Tax=Bifidobacterium biavatii DSM 23969 TaxID=1437608 RepID=A0A086ZSN4_9BIFI|nr:DNA replication and repair protein RecF [Bifidobacterium biavatii]KFI49534.1 DNA repair protein RecF [Bifidobacterium biavatii DSM 23969]
MHVSRLALDRYRSWEHCVVDFTPGVNILQGANGMGKTNIVEAVEVLSTGSSHRTSSSLPLVERGQSSAVIRANVVSGPSAGLSAPDMTSNANMGETGAYGASGAVHGQSGANESAATPANADGETTVTTYELTVAARGANRARVNGGNSLYMRDVIGRIPSVSFTPEDQRLVAGDPASRRTFLNQAGALLIPGYTDRLQTIAKIAKQRAALLKQLGARDVVPAAADAALSGLEIWTGQFIELGVAVTRDRRRIVDMIAEPFAAIYRSLAGDDQRAQLAYEPSFDEIFLTDDPLPRISEHFQRIYPGEVARGQNLIGPHRDDLSLLLAGMPAREFASNGEMWTMALALKMALFDVVARERGTRPIVILDDVFAQLDESRRSQILGFASRQDQVLITVAAASDIPDLAGRADTNVIDVGALKRTQDEYLHPDLSALLGADAARGGKTVTA